MGKWKASYDGGRKFKNEWLNEYSWVRKATDGSDSAFCAICSCSINAKKHALEQHQNSEKHKKRNPSPSLAPRFQVSNPSEADVQVKRA